MNDYPIMECRNLIKCYGSKTALTNLNLDIGRGRIVGLLGPNGSGKTTLIKLANGLIQPTSGTLLIDGKQPGIHSKSIISYLPDKNYFGDWMKVRDIFDTFADFYADFNRDKAIAMCESLGISENDSIKAMSKGTKEKVQLALVMCRDAELYLLDEPIAGVDPAARDYILKMIIGNYAENATIIISTHLVSDIESVLDEVVFIKNGQVVRHSTVDEIREQEGKSVDALFREEFKWGGEMYVR